MPDLSLFIPITKVDAVQHLVFGVATAEAEDRAGEICDYASTKPFYVEWSQEIARSTGGKSLGNLRAMHGPVAAGKVTAIEFNDEAKQIEICAKVVDAAEWIKVTEGVYTGFSQGGSYARRWTDENGLTRYTAVPSEISLVDLPCLPLACFEMIKADGSREWRGFDHGQDIAERLAFLVAELDWLQGAGILGDGIGEDEGPVPDKPRDLIARVTSVLRTLVTVKTGLSLGDDTAARAQKKMCISPRRTLQGRSLSLGQAGVSGGGIDQTRVDSSHTKLAELGVACGTEASMQTALEKRFDTIAATLSDVLHRVKNIEEQPLPLPLGGRPRAIAKHEDSGGDPRTGDAIETLLSDPDALSVLAIKLAQRNGRGPRR